MTELVDAETRAEIEEYYEQVLTTLQGSRDRLDRMARTLLDRETLEGGVCRGRHRS
jgi:ATP-dependent Zn protease